MLKIFVVLVVGIAAGAALSVPSEDMGEMVLKDQLMGALSREELDGKDALAGAALIACKVKPDGCYKLVRKRITTAYEHRLVYAAFRLEGFGKRAACYGAFGRFLCPGGLQDATP